jgi:hypothetical protein
MRALKVGFALLGAIIGALGSLASFFAWLGIKPKDLRMTGPHWLWLVAAIVFFVAGITPSVCLLYIEVKRYRIETAKEQAIIAEKENVARSEFQRKAIGTAVAFWQSLSKPPAPSKKKRSKTGDSH